MTVDTKCYELAKLFLQDEPDLNKYVYAMLLGEAIQTAIEDFIIEKKRAIRRSGE